MASNPTPVRFRPMPLPELLDELFRLYRNYFGLIVGVALIVVLPGLIWTLVTGTYRLSANSFQTLFNPSGAATFGPTSISSDELSRLFGLLALGGLGGVLLLPFSVGAVYRAVTDVALGRPAAVGTVLRETLARYLPLFGLVLIFFALLVAWAVLTSIGFVLLVLPGLAMVCVGIYFGVRWSLTVAAMMAEDVGPINGMRRSWALVSGMWWRTFGILLVVGILQSIIGLALGFLWGLIVGVALTGDLGLAVSQVGTTLLSAFVSPIVTIAIVLLYFDLRVRKEGPDLDQLARQTSPGPAPA
ncbi:MAG TPA: hypothetical protein VM674_00470 [Candidatus Acidoferrum sp.]|nr:hypothetical protein [Candidatus Acidoferrum sp.]